MAKMPVIVAGRSSRSVAWIAAVSGTVLFGALAAGMFLGEDALTTSRIVIGGVLVVAALACAPVLLLDAHARRHEVTACSLIYRHGVLTRCEIEIPFSSMRAVQVRQGLLQRCLGCGDVIITSQGVGAGSGLLTSSVDAHSIRLHSIPDHLEIGDRLREHLRNPVAFAHRTDD